MDKRKELDLQKKATQIRKYIIEEVFSAKSGHPGGSLSCTDILTVLYFDEMRVDPKNPKCPERDRFVLSKGHCAPALYATLAVKGSAGGAPCPSGQARRAYRAGSGNAGSGASGWF